MPNNNATSNRVAVRIVPETTFGTTPANPVYQDIRYTGESLNYDISFTQSKEIRSDRNVTNTIPTKASSAGDIQFELSSESFDQLLEAALCGTWSVTPFVVEDSNTAWTEITNANVTSTADTTDYKSGTASAKLVMAAGAAAGEKLQSKAIGPLNLATYTSVRGWVKSSVATAAGDLQLMLDDTALCASPLENIDFPALTASTWTYVTFVLAAPGTDTAIISIGVKQVVDLGVFTLWLDGFTAAPITGTLKNGTSLRSFSVQKHYQDMTTPVFQNFTGQRVGDFSLDFKPGSILTGKFGFMGLVAAVVTTQTTGAQIVPVGSDVPMNGVNNVQQIKEDGVTSILSYKSITMNLNNTLRAQDAIGSLAAIGIALGTGVITGAAEVYFSDLTMYNRFLASTSMNLSFMTQDASGSYYRFTLPSVKIETSKITSGGLDQDIMVSLTYRAIYDAVTACTLQIDRYEL